MTPMSARDKLIVALDFPSADAAARVAEKLRGRVGMFKVGLELFAAEGPILARNLVANGEKVFIDLKFHDIPNTVRAAAREAAQLGISILNVHASGGRKMMEAAREGAEEGARRIGRPRPLVVAVTVLTSLGDNNLGEIGVAGGAEVAVLRLARLARDAGLHGVVASPREIAALRHELGRDFVIVTPGIRPAAAATGDQVRVATPTSAIRAGADFLVVGRPIITAPDPAAAADSILAEIDEALMSSPTPGRDS
jgi:orotidine-5'-phosphate decarboxylase